MTELVVNLIFTISAVVSIAGVVAWIGCVMHFCFELLTGK